MIQSFLKKRIFAKTTSEPKNRTAHEGIAIGQALALALATMSFFTLAAHAGLTRLEHINLPVGQETDEIITAIETSLNRNRSLDLIEQTDYLRAFSTEKKTFATFLEESASRKEPVNTLSISTQTTPKATTTEKQAILTINKPAENFESKSAKIIFNIREEATETTQNFFEPYIPPAKELEEGFVSHIQTKRSPRFKSTRKHIATRRSKEFSFLHPVRNSQVTSHFGWRHGRRHQGIDLAAAYGSVIRSAEAGVVTYSGRMSGYGNFVTIRHKNGFKSSYAHLQRLKVHVGQHIKRGQTVGNIGMTGRTSGPHLHFEITHNGIHQNPSKFIY